MSSLELHDLEFVLVPQSNSKTNNGIEQFNVLLENKLICSTIELDSKWILVDTLTGRSEKFDLQESLENRILELANSSKKGNQKKCLTHLLS